VVENAETDVHAGVILAGGLSRRMGGGDKCLLPLGGRPVLAHVIERLRPQVTDLALNANGDSTRFARFGLDVVADDTADFAGPLAGILAAMDWAKRNHLAAAVLTVPGDTPFLPRDLAVRLAAAGVPALARSGGRIHPVVGLWPLALAEGLRNALRVEGIRKVEDWTRRLAPAVVDFEAAGSIDPFFNINTPEDLARAGALL
jgi:molybdopterin-guanine dinucleotide biosynthesis protein A